MDWYYAQGNQQAGPVSETELEQLVQAGTVRPETLVWKEGMAAWQPYSQVKPGGPTTPPIFSATGAPPADSVVCSQCGQIFPPDQVLRHGDLSVCANCKPLFLQKLREGVSVSNVMEYAGFWTRFAAKLVDGLILGAVLGIPMVLVVAGTTRGGGEPSGTAIAVQLLMQLGYIIINGLYSIFFVGKYGATPGKMVCKIKIVNVDGSSIGYGRATGRFFAEILSGMICYIGYIIAGFDDQKRALHDHICNTRVIQNR